MILGEIPFNVLSGYVYEGVWEKYHEPAFKRWIWTLKNTKALLILACLAILIAITQTRAWVLIRYVVFLRTKPVRLQDDTAPEPLRQLSQGRAILEALPSITNAISALRVVVRKALRIRAGQQEVLLHSDSSVVSPWFGIFAILNVGLFVIMGVAIPWFLSEGTLQAPIVKSRLTEECLTSESYQNVFYILNQPPKTDAVFEQCFGQFHQSCDDQYYFTRSQIHKTRAGACPFPGDICHNGTKPFEITHSNITAYEVGVNSRSRLTMNHRLTCAPVYLDSFLRFTPNASNGIYPTFISVRLQDLDAEEGVSPLFSMSLNTMNGPNCVSNRSSGLRMAQENGPYDLTVLPKYFAGDDGLNSSLKFIHTNLQRDDGREFLVIHRAGASRYTQQIDDPFFAAHNEVVRDNVDNTFYADHEATALGCLEQFQYCLPGSGFCTTWGAQSAQIGQVAVRLIEQDEASIDMASLAEIFALFDMLPAGLSIYGYLAQRTEWHRLVPLTRTSPWVDMLTFIDSPEDQWVAEVEKWFMKAVLDAIFYVQLGARFYLEDFDSVFGGDLVFDMDFKKEYSLCARVLFRDGDYTNINWVGFWTTAASFVFVCLISFMVEWIHETARIVFKTLADPLDLLIKLLTIAATLKWFAWNDRWRSTEAWWDSLEKFWRSCFIFHSSTAGRAWFGSRGPDSSTQSAELDEV